MSENRGLACKTLQLDVGVDKTEHCQSDANDHLVEQSGVDAIEQSPQFSHIISSIDCLAFHGPFSIGLLIESVVVPHEVLVQVLRDALLDLV